MTNEICQNGEWNLSLSNYDEYEYHDLSRNDLLSILNDEWHQSFNGIIIGRDINCAGRLHVHFLDDTAYVAYEDFVNGEWKQTFDLKVCEEHAWDYLIRLSPDDAHEYSFPRCSLVPKQVARAIVDRYVDTGELDGLYLADVNGKPVIK